MTYASHPPIKMFFNFTRKLSFAPVLLRARVLKANSARRFGPSNNVTKPRSIICDPWTLAALENVSWHSGGAR